jgi:hypothetical protein
MNRRVAANHALLYAVEKANELGLPVLVYEGLTCSYPHANDRIHTFVVANVPETQEALTALGIGYCFYLRQRPEDPNDVLYQLAARAALVVTDDYPTFIASWHNSSVPAKLGLAYHAVDSSCIIPMNRFEKREWAAYSMRPKVKRMLADHLVRRLWAQLLGERGKARLAAVNRKIRRILRKQIAQRNPLTTTIKSILQCGQCSARACVAKITTWHPAAVNPEIMQKSAGS